MRILVLGAGRVGTSVVSNLAQENYDVVVVDKDPAILRTLRDRFDIGTVSGNAAHPPVLERAGVAGADLIVAVTSDDETNILACQVAHTLYRVPKKIARIRAIEYTRNARLFGPQGLAVDVVISPEQIISDFISGLLKYPGASQVLDFARGRVRLVSVQAVAGGPLVSHPIRELHQHMPRVHARITAIFRQGHPLVPSGDQIIEPGDEVFFVAPPAEIKAVMSELRGRDYAYKRLMFAGGGHIGKRVAQSLEHRFQVKLIEKDPQRATKLAADLENTVVLVGDAADRELLLNENIENVDVFCAITNDDEANILSAMLAKKLGARRVISLINRPDYADLVERNLVDLVISPQEATIGSLLRHVRRGDVVQVHSLRRGAAEALESVAHGCPGRSKVVGRTIEKLGLPGGVVPGVIVRGKEVIQAHHDTRIQEGDHLIMFLLDKTLIPVVERLFAHPLVRAA
ncbi:trk system potassium uptake protein [Methylomarinovum caldicuralii]|uniref:Trk system potassium uptake protein TrkA n=1 Tax=Methylomarinovum caldicuralii TaxID=438856 RepID=A0AAU9BTV7_9GAMM|nr:Trk system potassium transporter TrkA [Methylomarinovum caldicuralii]BCX82368.1 trk system potassium uptake protein [Methylomarinovum caldicuralii]